MYKECNIHLLPSNDNENRNYPCILKYGWMFGESLSKLTYVDCNIRTPTISMKLYITDDSEIKDGDWFLTDIRDNIKQNNGAPIYEIEQCTSVNNGWIFTNNNTDIGLNPDWSKKIIATTNASIQWTIDKSPYPMEVYGLPQIPKQFIEYYIGEYNASREVKKVLVEYTECSLPEGACADCKIKVNCDDVNNPFVKIFISPTNEISIKPVETTIVHQFVKEVQDEFKDNPEVNLDYLTFAADHFMSKVKPVEEKMYSRDEVKEIAESAYHFGRLNSTISMPKFDNWLKENLK